MTRRPGGTCSRRHLLRAGGAAAALFAAFGCAAPAAPTPTPAPAKPAEAPAAPAKPTAEPTTAAKPAAAEPTRPAAAAAPTAAPTVAPAAKPAAAGGEPVKLILWSHNNKPMVDLIDKLIGEYKQSKPNVDIEYVSAAVQSHIDKVHVTEAAGTAPDGFNIIDTDFPLMISKNWLAPVVPEAFGVKAQREVHDLFFAFMMSPAEDNKGNVYGVPMNWAALSVLYNVKSVEKAGLDPQKPFTDWPSLTEAAVKLTEKDAQGNVLKPGWQQNYGPGTEWPVKRLYPMIHQLGGAVVSDDGTESLITSPEAQEAIQLYTDWTAKHKVSVKGYQPPGVQGLDLFVQGYTPMIVSGAYYLPVVKDQKPDFQYGRDFRAIGFPQWPAGKNKKTLAPLWGWDWFVSASSKNKEPMWAWYNFMTSPENDERFQKAAGHLKIRRAGGDSPFPKDFPKEAEAIMLKDHENSLPAPRTVKFEEMAKQLVEMMERIETGQQPVKAAAEEAKRKIDAVLKAP
jgi:ABC-type glycerol-3-phosphate transport system substrate-binding protein